MMKSKNERNNLKIGEVAKMFNVNPSLLRFWESEFEQLKPLKTKGGERIYRKEHIELISQIYDLTKVKGYTIKGAKEILSIDTGKLEYKKELVNKLNRIRSFLENLKVNLEEE